MRKFKIWYIWKKIMFYTYISINSCKHFRVIMDYILKTSLGVNTVATAISSSIIIFIS